MGELIHCRMTPEGPRFRIWNSNSDRYSTEPMTEEEIRDLLHDWNPYRLGPTTLVEAVKMPGLSRGRVGRVEGQYSRVGITSMRVRWDDGTLTEHPIQSATRWMGYEIVDPRILYLATIDHEGPEKRLARARQFGTSALDAHNWDHVPLDLPVLSEPWEKERCKFCNSYHHSFRPSTVENESQYCGSCGQEENSEDGKRYHGLPCTE